jgi:hypothetical protein
MYKTKIFITIVCAAGIFITLGLFVYGLMSIKVDEPKTICVQSHDITDYEYGYRIGFGGKPGWGFHFVTKTICDKEAPNPKYVEPVSH